MYNCSFETDTCDSKDTVDGPVVAVKNETAKSRTKKANNEKINDSPTAFHPKF